MLYPLIYSIFLTDFVEIFSKLLKFNYKFIYYIFKFIILHFLGGNFRKMLYLL